MPKTEKFEPQPFEASRLIGITWLEALPFLLNVFKQDVPPDARTDALELLQRMAKAADHDAARQRAMLHDGITGYEVTEKMFAAMGHHVDTKA